jgi:hypothetical protein
LRASCPGGDAAREGAGGFGTGAVSDIISRGLGSCAAAAFPQQGNGHSITPSPGSLSGLKNVVWTGGAGGDGDVEPMSSIFGAKGVPRDSTLPILCRNVSSLDWCWAMNQFSERLTLASQAVLNHLGPALAVVTGTGPLCPTYSIRASTAFSFLICSLTGVVIRHEEGQPVQPRHVDLMHRLPAGADELVSYD